MASSKSSSPREQALAHLKSALASGVRGNLRDAILHAIDVAEDNGRGDLTDVHYRNLSAGKTLPDPRRPGFLLRANKSRSIWLYRYDHPETHKQEFLELGDYPEMALADARACWQEARDRRLKGEDPAAPVGTDSPLPFVRELVEQYLTDYAKKVKRSWAEDEDHFDREFLPQYGNLRVDELTAEQITSRLFEIKERGSPRTAEKLRAYLSAMFRVAMGKSRKIDYPNGPWLPSTFRNPMDGVPLLALRQARSVALKVSELRAFLRNLSRVREDVGQILRLQLETCSRIGEVLGLRWTEIDWTEGVWTLPAGRSKNKIEHRVMLSRQSVALLEARRGWETLSEFVFPAPRNRKRQIKRDTMMGTFTAAREVLGVPAGATTHSLRHTCITQLASMGCPRDVRDRIANHKPPQSDMDARYNRYSLDAEAREWLQRWADRLDVLADGNVVELERRGADHG
jgi:integrase